MNTLIINQQIDSPSVILDPINKVFVIAGESRPENARAFFQPILDWFLEYENTLYYLKNESSKNLELDFTFKFEYFNSTSAKYILDILLLLKKFNNCGYIFKIAWYYDERDDDMLNSGEEFCFITGLNFKFHTFA